MNKLRIAIAAMSATCLLAALPACGSNTAPAASNSASTSSVAETTKLSLDDVKQAMNLGTIYIIQNSTDVSIEKVLESAGFEFVKSVACDDVIDTSLEQSKSVTYKITVDEQALAEKLGLANADQYSGETEFEITGRVNVISESEAAELAAKDGNAVIVKTGNESYQPVADEPAPTDESNGDAEVTTETPDSGKSDSAPSSTGTSTKTETGNTSTGNTGTQNTGNSGAASNTGTGNKNTGSTGNSGTSNTGNQNTGASGNTGSGSKNTGSTGSTGTTTNTGTATGGSSKPEHTHNWQPVYKTVHHDEVGHTETVTVKEAYDEPVREERNICSACGYSCVTVEEIADHIDFTHDGAAAYRNDWVQIGTTHHDAVTEQKYVVDQAAYDEQVIDHYSCSCGATK